MSLDPYKLKEGDKVVFFQLLVKKVSRIEYNSSIDNRPHGISFSDGDHLEIYSLFWDFARLEIAE